MNVVNASKTANVDLSTKTALLIDRGSFLSMAQRLARDFGKVYYCSQWYDTFPYVDRYAIGYGVEEFERVDDFWDVIKECDCIIFPDIFDSGLQLHLEELGYPVWGSRRGDEFEIYRADFKRTITDLGLPVGKYEIIKGVDNLRLYLKSNDDKHVKITLFRGITETFHHEKYSSSEGILDYIKFMLGAFASEAEFVVEDPIDAISEVASDIYSIDGKFPSSCMFGCEVKDVAYAAKVIKYEQLPDQVKDVNTAIVPLLKDYGYRNEIAMEIRIAKKDKKGYPIDPCMRSGSPPSELFQEMLKNYSLIRYEGARGNLVEPEWAAPYGVQALIWSTWANKNWNGLEIPEEIKQWVKIKNFCTIKGKPYIIPQDIGMTQHGSIVGIGNSLEEAIDKIKGYAKLLKGYDIDVKVDKLDQATDELNKVLKFLKK